MLFAIDDSTFHQNHILDMMRLNEANAYYSSVPSSFYQPSHKFKASNISVVSSTNTVFSGKALVYYRDAWLDDTLNQIEANRLYKDNWDSQGALAPSSEALYWAEYTAQAFTALPMTKRPQYSLDIDGRPSFTMYNNDLYLHLTIHADGVASWYSVINEQEYFDEVELSQVDPDEFAIKVVPV